MVNPVRLPVVLHRRSPTNDLRPDRDEGITDIVEVHIVVRLKRTGVAVGADLSTLITDQLLLRPRHDLARQRLNVEVELDDVCVGEVLEPADELLLGHARVPLPGTISVFFVDENLNGVLHGDALGIGGRFTSPHQQKGERGLGNASGSRRKRVDVNAEFGDAVEAASSHSGLVLDDPSRRPRHAILHGECSKIGTVKDQAIRVSVSGLVEPFTELDLIRSESRSHVFP